jgi:hypothetical protein
MTLGMHLAPVLTKHGPSVTICKKASAWWDNRCYHPVKCQAYNGGAKFDHFKDIMATIGWANVTLKVCQDYIDKSSQHMELGTHQESV